MFKDTYKEKFDAIHPDPMLRQVIEERMNDMKYGNERRYIHTNLSRRMVAVLAALLVLMLTATAVAVVRGNLLRSKLEEQGDATIAAQVQDVHVSDAAEEFSFTVDEVVWEDDQLWVSYTVSVPDDGNTYLYGISGPMLNGEKLDYKALGYFDEAWPVGGTVYAAGGDYPATVSDVLKEIKVDPAQKESADNRLELEVHFFRTDREIREIESDALEEMMVRKNHVWQGDFEEQYDVLESSDVLYYYNRGLERDAAPAFYLGCYPEVYALHIAKMKALPEFEPETGIDALGWEYTDWSAYRQAMEETYVMTPEEFSDTGIAELAAERALTIPLNAANAEDIVYNDLAEHRFEMEGYTVEIENFYLSHFAARFAGTVLSDELPERSYILLRKDGSALGEDLSYFLGVSRSGHGMDIDGEIRGIFSLEDVDELLLVPIAEHEEGSDPVYAMEEAIRIHPIYNPE